jgi:hypothetical protein
VSRPLLPLLIVEGIRKIDPEAAIVAENAPHFVKDEKQVTDKIIGMGLMAKLTCSSVRPRYGRAIAA